MPKLTVSVKDRGALTTGLATRVKDFTAAVDAATTSAAQTATTVSQSGFKRVRPIAPKRPGRHGSGQMSASVKWRRVKAGEDVAVGLNMADLNRDQPHWIIQEIGTGKRATLKVGGDPRPKGRPTKGATYVRTVKSQVGRRISSSLVFATGPGGKYAKPGSADGQQLFLRSQVKGSPVRASKIRIKSEIRGQHFVQRGGEAGFREYRKTVLGAARQQFRKGRAS